MPMPFAARPDDYEVDDLGKSYDAKGEPLRIKFVMKYKDAEGKDMGIRHMEIDKANFSALMQDEGEKFDQLFGQIPEVETSLKSNVKAQLPIALAIQMWNAKG